MTAPAFNNLSVDWTAPERVDEEGRSHFLVRCRVPFVFSCHGDSSFVRMPGDDMDDAEETEEESVQRAANGDYLVEGISSSTSVDWYGTEMSFAALEGMAAQMRQGVALVPTHWESEWDDVMGLSVEAVVERVRRVENAAEPGEQQFVLRVKSRASADHEKTKALVRALEQGVKIGQSIGGWFTEVRFVTDEYGDVERVIIEDVTLDHNALTRTPANPDSWLENLRTAAEPALRARVAMRAEAAAAPAPVVTEPEPAMAARSVVTEPSAPAPTEEPAAAPVERETPKVEAVAETPEPEQRSEPAPLPAEEPTPATDASTPSVARTSTPEDTEMTPEQIAEIVNAAVRSAVEPLQNEVEQLRTAQAPKNTEPTAEEREAELRAQLAERDRQLLALAQKPQSRAVGRVVIPTGPEAQDEVRAVFTREGRHAMAALLGDEHFRARNDGREWDDCTFEEQKTRRESAKSDLSTILRAAEADGSLKQWWRDAAAA